MLQLDSFNNILMLQFIRVVGGGMLALSNIHRLQKLTRKHRGNAAPEIATFLLVAIALYDTQQFIGLPAEFIILAGDTR